MFRAYFHLECDFAILYCRFLETENILQYFNFKLLKYAFKDDQEVEMYMLCGICFNKNLVYSTGSSIKDTCSYIFRLILIYADIFTCYKYYDFGSYCCSHHAH